MKIARLAFLSICLSFSLPALAVNWSASQITYEAEGWTVGEIYGLNNLGQVIGAMEPASPRPPGIWEPVFMGFVTGPDGKNMRPIDPAYEPYVEYCRGCAEIYIPRVINDSGQIAVMRRDTLRDYHLILSGPHGGPITPPLGGFGPSDANVSMNNSGQLAVTYAYGPPSSFVTDANGSNPHFPGVLDNSYDSYIEGINDHGQLLVWGVPQGSTEPIQFVTGANATGVAFEIESPGTIGGAWGLNNAAQLYGAYQNPQGVWASFITGANGTGFTDIGNLGGHTFAYGINNDGLLVGQSGGKAFLYGFGGGNILDLNQLVTLRAGEFLTGAIDINDRNQIAAVSNLGFMYLISPVPEPATYLMMLLGLAYLTYRARGQSLRFT